MLDCPLLASALKAWPWIALIDLLRYLLVASALALLAGLLPRVWLARRSVRIRRVLPGQVRRELLRSCRTALVFSLTGTGVFVGAQAGVFRVYEASDRYGLWWLPVSFVLVLVLHDAWFYWTHRLLHQRGLYRWAHHPHHESMAPTPWAAYSFSVPEAVVQSVFLPLVLLLVPLHPSVIFAWMAFMVLRNVQGHSGTE